MASPKRTIEAVLSGQGVVAFTDLQRLLEKLGFTLARVNGSHHIYLHPRVPRPMNVQRVGRDAKPYQVRQLRDMIKQFGLNSMTEPANRYAIVVSWSEEDGGWIADVPDLKSCSAFGNTREEAVAEVGIAIDAWLAAAREAGLPIPEPRFQPHHEAAE